ncbi:CD2-associated isoform X1 [Pelobates cultripes]|uniref:CD2-associated isoform X1 n=1 Tax=Pelobates cultripes TaxID=61616 RepID=A0AAD1VQ90_PELCU|nr:CD2-associated isoform X1 [Pelobates cultripes]
MVEYIVEYDYDAEHEDELTMRVGDIIRNVKKLEEEGWLEGEIHGRRGAFPDNFVKEIKKDAEPKDEHIATKREKPGNVASLVQRMSVYGIPGMGPPPQAKPLKKKSKKRQCKVLFDYLPQNEDELELKAGEILDIIEEVEEGWWSGSHGGKSGLFPSNFVKEVDTVDDGDSVELPEDPVEPVAVNASPASPVQPPGNGLEAALSPVAQPKKIMGVGFGDIFKEGSVKLKTRIPNSEPEIKKLEKPLPTNPSGTKLSHTLSSEFTRTETDGKNKAKETCRAMYSYEGVNDDELSFKEGDIIHLLSKDTGDPGWWKGELNGKEGVFPDNFAVIILESEREKPKKPPPPVKSPATPKPELRIGEKRFTPSKLEERASSVDEKPSLDIKPSKPAAPQVPPKKPILVSKSNSLVKPGTIPPKRPEKPALPTPVSKPNGDLPPSRPKSEPEPFSKTKMDLEHILSRPKSIEAEPCAVKSPRDNELISFDDLMPTSENLSHPTASRPKVPGKRLPGRFNGVNSHSTDLTDNLKVAKDEEGESAKVKAPEVKKTPLSTSTPPVSTSTPPVTTPSLVKLPNSATPPVTTPTPSLVKLPNSATPPVTTPTPSLVKLPNSATPPVTTPTPSLVKIPNPSTPSVTTPTSSLAKLPNPLIPIPLSPVILTPVPAEFKVKSDVNEGKKSELEELKAQVGELLTIVDALRKEHRNELEKIKKDLEHEKLLRTSLESEIEKLKNAVHLT